MRNTKKFFLVGVALSLASAACGSSSQDKDAAATGGAGGTPTGGSTGGSGGGTGGATGGSPADASAVSDGAATADSAAADGSASDGAADGPAATSDGAAGAMSFFVTSDTATSGNLGGLAMADMRCQTLAAAAGAGSHTWHAYLSTATVSARDRIGTGPWYNAKGALVASSVADLHTKKGNYMVFINEKGGFINGQWGGSPSPNQHDVLTGSIADGTVSAGNTCSDWTAATGTAQVGHADGLGPNMDMSGSRPSWNAAHTQPCNDPASTGGAAKLYCFAVN